ncbi:MAG TPA: hypothetical protein PKA28_17885 [Methylomusa anaerophila]|uniref:Uncharacterized protein n=1 Tax=Methylomusa anaerophila TaxID=1930071 RepID=A0A348AQL9_9FIRM|nr:hypothetical protein [Methylomusa anaerophila]BBB93367.1 hypothetical protein MAMMFC1_04079 [Methylomusa anaerophila]HML90314.1 hypothetical protein [Methylomusa anaerophila]
MEVVGDENNAANTFYRIRDVRNAGLTIIAEYNAPDDFFLNNSRDTFLVYSQNKFCLLSFPGAGAAVIRILQNGAWE